MQNLLEIDRLASEETVFSSKQAARAGIPRYALTRAVEAGFLRRLARGVYTRASEFDDGLTAARATLLACAPSAFSHERRGGGFDGFALRGESAAFALGIGNFYLSPVDIAAPRVTKGLPGGSTAKVEELTERDVCWPRGLPATKPARTIADLLGDAQDESLVAEALVDAVRQYGSGSLTIGDLKHELGSRRAVDDLLGSSGLEVELIELDRLGHVAIREKGDWR